VFRLTGPRRRAAPAHRVKLAEEGAITILGILNTKTGLLAEPVEFISRGFVHDAEEVRAEIEALGRKAYIVLGDLTTRDAVNKVVAEAIDKAGSIDVLVNNAGACIHRPALEIPDDESSHVIDTNLTALWHVSQEVGAHMVARGSGSIVNVGSISAMIVNRPQFQPAYNASKAAVHQLTKSLAAEWAPLGVRVNAVPPGYIKTDMSPVDEPQYRRMWIEDSAQQRYASPDEVSPSMSES